MEAQVQQRNALATQEQAKADSLRDPRKAVDASKTVQTDDGVYQLNPETGKYDMRVGDRVEKVKSPEQQAYEGYVSQGMSPVTAFQKINQDKNQKDGSFQQQFLDAYTKAHPDVPLTDAIAATIRATSTQPKIEIHQASAAASAPAGSGGGGGTSATVQGIIEGRIPAPNVRTKQGLALMQQVTAADPSYDASRYNTYQAMQKEATSGHLGQAINSLGTVQEHINDALNNLPKNGEVRFFNNIRNTASEAMGQNPTGKFDVDATGIAGEWGKLVAGGVASETEQKHVQSLLDKDASPRKQRENLEEIRRLTQGKLQAIQAQIKSAGHPNGPGNPISSVPASVVGGGGVKRYNPATGRIE
jgi:hypothetical protein